MTVLTVQDLAGGYAAADHVVKGISFATAVLGGLGSIPGAVAGAITIGVAEEIAVLVFSPAYRQVVGFVAILAVLALRPAGFFGTRAT